MKTLGIDIGYSSTKIAYDGQFYKLPTAISFAMDTGIDYGEDCIINFEGEQLYIGEAAVSEESFTTTDYKFKHKYDPAIIYHILVKLNLLEDAKNGNLVLALGLALADWKNKDEYLERVSNFTIDEIALSFKNINLIPQGAGAYINYITNSGGNHPSNCSVIDIGYNTINFLYFEGGQPKKAQCKSFPGHGVSSIIRPMTNHLEANYGMSFSEQEVIKIFQNEKFIFNGVPQENITKTIIELKQQFVKKLFSSILTSEKKLLATSEVVLFAGGGCYLLENIKFPPNVKFVDKPYEHANVLGYIGK